MSDMSSSAPSLPQLSLSLDLIPSPSASRQLRGSASETSTLSDHHDFPLASYCSSARSSCCSSTASVSSSSNSPNPTKPTKRVRFEESVCCSYFVDAPFTTTTTTTTSPEYIHIRPRRHTLEKKPSFLGRSWQRFRRTNTSQEQLEAVMNGADFHGLKREDGECDLLEVRSKTGGAYSVRQPLREAAGRRYERADTMSCWRASAAAAAAAAPKGDWNDLLGGR